MKVVARVRVEATANPTESVAKVKAACLNVFPDLTFTHDGTALVGNGSDLRRFRELIRYERIRDSARAVLIRQRHGNATSFSLSKQAAYVGRLNFASGAPLGDLAVTIEDEDLDALIDDVAESTVGKRLTRPDRTEDT